MPSWSFSVTRRTNEIADSWGGGGVVIAVLDVNNAEEADRRVTIKLHAASLTCGTLQLQYSWEWRVQIAGNVA